jgi:uncharacterized protein YbjT (DUF2867 family)
LKQLRFANWRFLRESTFRSQPHEKDACFCAVARVEDLCSNITVTQPQTVFVTGGTGYIGRALVPQLLERGHEIIALARAHSAARLPAKCRAVIGDPLDRKTFVACLPANATFLQLVGVAHPSPAKAKQFREIDLVSVRESVAAAVAAKICHFIYLSVAQPAPLMKEYLAVRAEGEAMIRAAGLRATILRPWYVLGPGHRWPCALLPLYWICERLPGLGPGARRLGLVTLKQMVGALVDAVENLPRELMKIVAVPDIRASIRVTQDP